MVSFELRRTLKTTAGILTVAAVVAPCIVFSQPEFLPAADDALREVAEKISEVQSQYGPHSPDLIDPLTALGLFYQENGNLDLAAAAVEQARLVVRVNYGLYSLEEAPLIRQLIHNEEAKGNFEVAWDLEQKLLTLARRHPNDLRTVPILRQIADKRMDVLERYQAGEFPPQIILGCYYNGRRYDGAGNCRAGSRRVVIASILSEARGYYADADKIIRRHESWASLAASDCESPPIPEIPDNEGLSKRELRSVEGNVLQYLKEMTDYVGCVQAQYEGATRANAPPAQLSQLASQSDAAVAELEEVRVIYEERIGPIMDLGR
jgi:tetratricopeptide (TPR) repeat protein